MLRSGTKPVLALQPINPMGELGYFGHLKQRSREQNLTRKRTSVELCDDDTNILVAKPKKAKSVSELADIEIDTLDCLCFIIRRNGKNKSWRLLLLSTRTLRGEVSRQAPSLSHCWGGVK